MAEQNMNATQRAALFANATRQNMQMLPKQTATSGATTMTFTLPKARLLSKILLDVTATVKVTHPTKTELPSFDVFTPYRLLRRISLDLNNGFSPYVIGGAEACMLNMIHRGNAQYMASPFVNSSEDETAGTNHFGYWLNKGASADGKVNKVRFTLELPVTLNDRDPVSLILLQNDTTNVSLVLDFANGSDMFDGIDGYTIDITGVEATPMLETFSVPASTTAFPDLSVLKLTTSRNDSYVGAGQHIIKMSTGTIYRRIIFRILDENGNPVDDEEITSNISLVFNQADTNYDISARHLRMLNTTQYGFTLPKGMFVFDFAYQGVAGLSGSRDYVDTERLTEMWLRYSTGGSGRIQIVSECLAMLQ